MAPGLHILSNASSAHLRTTRNSPTCRVGPTPLRRRATNVGRPPERTTAVYRPLAPRRRFRRQHVALPTAGTEINFCLRADRLARLPRVRR